MNSPTVNDVQKFKDLVNEVKVAALITHAEDQGLKGRPMSTAGVDEDGCLWFFTNEYSGKVQQISKDHEVILSYSSRSDNTYIIVRGMSELVDDKTKMQSLWNPALKVWFPEGLNDPAILLLKVKPKDVEIWDGSSNKLVVGFQMLKAFIKGEEYNDGEHIKLNMP